MNIASILNKKPWIIAVSIITILTIWMISGTNAEQAEVKSVTKLENKSLTKVRVERREASEIASVIELHGRTEADRKSKLSAETSGRVESILVERGQVVRAGEVIIKLAEKDKKLRLRQAKATLKQRELEYEAALTLKKSGLTAQTKIAENQANLELARAELEQAQLDIAYTEIRAPFDGIFNERMVEVGDLVNVGTEVGEVLDVDPIIVRGDIPELEVANVRLGQYGVAKLITRQSFDGNVRYLSASSNDSTHTFKVELAIENKDNNVPVGVTATIKLQADKVLAHKVSPAAISLSKNGGLGIKVIDENNQVAFKPVEIIRSEKDGVWLSGLANQENIITVGQGFVDDGDTVEPDYVDSDYSPEKVAARNAMKAKDVTTQTTSTEEKKLVAGASSNE